MDPVPFRDGSANTRSGGCTTTATPCRGLGPNHTTGESSRRGRAHSWMTATSGRRLVRRLSLASNEPRQQFQVTRRISNLRAAVQRNALLLRVHSRLDGGDVDLRHRHHRLERTSGPIAAPGECIGQYPRGDLPADAPFVLAPAAATFLPAIADDRVPVAVGLFLVLGRDLE